MKMEMVVTGALLAGLFAGCAAEWEKNGELTLAVRGRPPAYTIVLPAEPSPSQVTAAAELRHHVAEMTGVEKGDAFTVGTCSLPDFKKRDIRNSHVKIDRVKTDGYAWYEIDGVWTPKGDENVWVANGNFRKNVDKGNPCVRAVFVDAIELTRVDAE